MPKWALPVAISVGAAIAWVGLERYNFRELNHPPTAKAIPEPFGAGRRAVEEGIPQGGGSRPANESSVGSIVSGPATERTPDAITVPGTASDEMRDREWDARRDPSLDQLMVLSAEWVSAYFEYCAGPNRRVPMDCTKVRDIAMTLALEGDGPVEGRDSRTNADLAGFAMRGIDQRWIEGVRTTCNDKGCLMYVTIIVGDGGSDFDAFVQGLLEQSWVREFKLVTDARTRSARHFSMHPQPLRTAITRRHASYLFIFLAPD